MDNTTLTGPGYTPNADLPPLDPTAEKRTMLVEIQVAANFEKRLDNQWMVEREIHADRWRWEWVKTVGDKQDEIAQLVREFLAWQPEHAQHAEAMRVFGEWAKTRMCVTLG